MAESQSMLSRRQSCWKIHEPERGAIIALQQDRQQKAFSPPHFILFSSVPLAGLPSHGVKAKSGSGVVGLTFRVLAQARSPPDGVVVCIDLPQAAHHVQLVVCAHIRSTLVLRSPALESIRPEGYI